MASNATLRILGALTIAMFIPTIVRQKCQTDPRYKRLKVIPRLCDETDRAITMARHHWPKDMTPKEASRFVGKLEFVEKNMFGPEVHICLFIHFAFLILRQCQSELWDAGSRKGGALDGVLRCLEDLHVKLVGTGEDGKAEDEECQGKAEEYWREYLGLWE